MGVRVRGPWFDEKISMTKKLGLAALFGAVPIIGGLLLRGRWLLPKTMLLFGAAILIIPVVFYLNILTIEHWKRRYKGEKSDFWGAILLIETSG
jgi:hypothetical protein